MSRLVVTAIGSLGHIHPKNERWNDRNIVGINDVVGFATVLTAIALGAKIILFSN